jgi:hypothetical protein
MPTWVFKALGFTTPFIIAASCYFICRYLDKRASGPAKSAISDWFARRYDRQAVSATMVEVFDRIYTPRLLSARGFLRSVAISLAVTTLMVMLFFRPAIYIAVQLPHMRDVYIQHIVTNIISDYVSLFFIRWWLVRAGQRPVLSLIVGALVGITIVLVCYIVRDIGDFAWSQGEFHLRYFPEWAVWWVRKMTGSGTNKYFVYAAFAVHFWLLLFALGVLIMQGLNYTLKAVQLAQWFLKQGRSHPFDALGLILTPLVFIIAAVIQWWTL